MVDDPTAEDEFFRELGGTCAQLRQGFARKTGMTTPRLQVLVRLRRDGETSHSDLRRALDIDGASITRLIKTLEAEGLVRRRPDPADNRYTLAELTPAGLRSAAELEQSHQTYQERLLDGVHDSERDLVLRVLRRIRSNATDQENR